jgi:hypothetical protein
MERMTTLFTYAFHFNTLAKCLNLCEQLVAMDESSTNHQYDHRSTEIRLLQCCATRVSSREMIRAREWLTRVEPRARRDERGKKDATNKTKARCARLRSSTQTACSLSSVLEGRGGTRRKLGGRQRILGQCETTSRWNSLELQGDTRPFYT